jgi:prevent-host-death family protein
MATARPAALRDLPAVSASDAKNAFGRALETALHHGAVAITRHGRPSAVLLSLPRYEALMAERHVSLDALAAELDGLLAGMQTPAARRGTEKAFAATAAEMGRAAAAPYRRKAAARRRRTRG